jgi:hypothetical protein
MEVDWATNRMNVSIKGENRQEYLNVQIPF